MSAEKPSSGDGPAAGGPPPAAIPPAVESPPPGHGHGGHIQFRFLDQLKRRNVGRIAILYVAVCYLILEPFELFFHLLELPAWTGRTVVLLMVLGFPAALIFAWVFEITPDGIKPTVEVDPRRSIVKQTGRRLDRAIIVLLALALIYFVIDKFWLSRRVADEKPVAPTVTMKAPTIAPTTPIISEKSVAVLPFLDMSEKKDQEYFSDGLAEELIDMLTKVPDLRVPARTSSFYFKGKSEDIPTIARRLLVAHVLEGSVRKSGRNLRITVQLVRADNGYHLWSETYDRALDDIFKMQDEIAAAVVKALKVSLLEGAVAQSAAKPNADAYTLYLQGRAMMRLASTKTEWENAVDYFQRAVSVDPTFATAWAWLAYTRCDEVVFGVMDRQVVATETRRAADRAFALNPNLADAHGAIAMIKYHFDWNWVAAAAEFKQAHDLDPADAGGAKVLADVLFQLGADDETVMRLYQQAINLDPVHALNFSTLSSYHLYMGRLPEAEAAARKALDLNPTGWEYHALLGTVMLARGNSTQALAEFRREPDESTRRKRVALAYHALGRKEEADAALTEVERKDAATGAYGIAEIYAYRGELNQAFGWLDRAYRQRDAGLTITNRDPLLNNLKSDPRYKAFLRKMKLPE
jgi:adenylate cyclase